MELVILCIISYFIGSLPFGYWIGKVFYGRDIRTEGSGNIGTTNTLRVLGPVAGVAVLLLDLFKGTLAGALPTLLGMHHINPFITGFFAIIGHTFSIWLKFKGGKAVATSAGVLIAYNPFFFAVAVITLVVMLFLFSMMSVGSIMGFIMVTATAAMFHDWVLTIIAGVLTIFVTYRHRANLKRVLQGNESLMHFGLYYWLTKRK
ncbi:glycerol-3-phosphate 1-O-acyltransferase PlsY [Periweissella fabalis]|uniref:Glycerol-3-phosphate acyltransferase n=1 Tax=Periweissella fabalis TaxID=1070421 RepID=A0A7X6S2P3_9LACO|nr:glycerol-3-phosphate 1-O-acyltransferase PlsY [Periweissella fabalis]MCM0598927.1 glycerol-3-phosphate 1-O-acyltransferase PlsY [Periweissella fabalis]NKZ23207.1 glycerol-3-phosphate 1-O-acyltransferase PlsY [Periweissella fabalis]